MFKGQTDTVCCIRNALSPIPSRTTDRAALVPLYGPVTATNLDARVHSEERKPLSKPGISNSKEREHNSGTGPHKCREISSVGPPAPGGEHRGRHQRQ